jgi:hypothetical protein
MRSNTEIEKIDQISAPTTKNSVLYNRLIVRIASSESFIIWGRNFKYGYRIISPPRSSHPFNRIPTRISSESDKIRHNLLEFGRILCGSNSRNPTDRILTTSDMDPTGII